MSDPVRELVKAQLKQLRLPAMARELERLSREAAASNMNYEQFLLRLAEAELAARPATRWSRGSRTRRSRWPRTSTPSTSP